VESIDDNEATISRTSTGPLAEDRNRGGDQRSAAANQTFLSPRERELFRRIEQLEMSLASKTQHTGNRSFYWLTCKPAQCYHSKWQVQSLDVYTPVIRELATTSKIRKYMDEKEEEARAPGTPTSKSKPTPKQIRKLIIPEDMHRMSAFQLFLDDDSRFVPQTKLILDLPAGAHRENSRLSLDESVSCN